MDWLPQYTLCSSTPHFHCYPHTRGADGDQVAKVAGKRILVLWIICCICDFFLLFHFASLFFISRIEQHAFVLFSATFVWDIFKLSIFSFFFAISLQCGCYEQLIVARETAATPPSPPPAVAAARAAIEVLSWSCLSWTKLAYNVYMYQSPQPTRIYAHLHAYKGKHTHLRSFSWGAWIFHVFHLSLLEATISSFWRNQQIEIDFWLENIWFFAWLRVSEQDVRCLRY